MIELGKLAKQMLRETPENIFGVEKLVRRHREDTSRHAMSIFALLLFAVANAERRLLLAADFGMHS